MFAHDKRRERRRRFFLRPRLKYAPACFQILFTFQGQYFRGVCERVRVRKVLVKELISIPVVLFVHQNHSPFPWNLEDLEFLKISSTCLCMLPHIECEMPVEVLLHAQRRGFFLREEENQLLKEQYRPTLFDFVVDETDALWIFNVEKDAQKLSTAHKGSSPNFHP